jgi:dihydrofolate reductase
MRIVVFNNLTLDGVSQGPGRPDEDTRGRFTHGGWSPPYADAVLGSYVAEGMGSSGALLLGRRTYEDFFSVWPKRKDGNPFTKVLDDTQKYVASRTLKEALPWCNSTLLAGDATETVAKLKERPGKDLVVLGSVELVQSLARRDLIDEYQLIIHPLILGTGRRLFAEGGPYAALQLVVARPTTTGVVLATYRPVRRTERDR